MLGDFKYYNPTQLYFGKDAMNTLSGELAKYGDRIVLVYGKGAIKRIGVYDQVIDILKKTGKTVTEISGVMSNPTIQKVYEGIDIVRKTDADLILAVGGGSVIDYAKAVAGSAYCDEDPWQRFYIERKLVENKVIPVGCILTMVGTGSEMNDNGTITNHETKEKIGYKFGDDAYPKFAIMNPEFTYSLPRYQMVAGMFDIMSHIMEQYFSNDDDNTSDYIAEGLMNSLIHSSLIAIKDPKNYEARSNIMWTATWALNNLIAMGKTQDWEVHMMGQAIAAYTDATHGMTLSAISLPYYRYISQFGKSKFVRFAKNVWHIQAENKSDDQVVEEGFKAMADWMKQLGVAMKIEDVGVTADMIDEIAAHTPILDAGYKKLTEKEIADIYRASL